MTRLLLCTDLDRTLLPNGAQPESPKARELFSRLVSRDEVTLAFVTGRDPKLVDEAIDTYHLPHPDYVIADVGSSIYQYNNGNWRHWEKWEQTINHAWGGKSHDAIADLLGEFQSLELQEKSKQATHKLSYYVPLSIDHQPLIDNIESTLNRHGIDANLIWSIDEAKNVGLLDVLPGNAGKREAIEFLTNQLKFQFNELVFSGDSGNDLCVLVSPIQSILVANASEDVKNSAIVQATENNTLSQLYLAKGDFHDLNGNYSSGILEGVVHYIKQAESWIWSE